MPSCDPPESVPPTDRVDTRWPRAAGSAAGQPALPLRVELGDRRRPSEQTPLRQPAPGGGNGGAVPYGVVADRADNIWIALWSGGKIVKFDTSNNSWTEFTAPTYPAHTRLLNIDSENNVWWGIYSAGKRPGKLVKLDQATGKMTEWTIPQQNAEPYDVAADPRDNIWAADVGQRTDGE